MLLVEPGAAWLPGGGAQEPRVMKPAALEEVAAGADAGGLLPVTLNFPESADDAARPDPSDAWLLLAPGEAADVTDLLLGGGYDPDGDGSTVDSVADPSPGLLVVLGADGRVSVLAEPGLSTASFSYQLRDADGGVSAVATLSLLVEADPALEKTEAAEGLGAGAALEDGRDEAPYLLLDELTERSHPYAYDFETVNGVYQGPSVEVLALYEAVVAERWGEDVAVLGIPFALLDGADATRGSLMGRLEVVEVEGHLLTDLAPYARYGSATGANHEAKGRGVGVDQNANDREGGADDFWITGYTRDDSYLGRDYGIDDRDSSGGESEGAVFVEVVDTPETLSLG
ncbi:MAG: hypothetical protein AAF371_05260 [Pseudomonadota bacterium]